MKKLKKILAATLSLCIAGSAAAAFAPTAKAAQPVNGLFISEVCFNPNYEGLSSKVIENNDYFEFVEIKNVGSSDINLNGSALWYSKEGPAGSNWYKQEFVFDSSNNKVIKSGDVWVIGVYTIDTPKLGFGYSNANELKAYWSAFNNYYGTSIPAEKRVLAVAAQSGSATWLSNATSLPNSGTAGALKIGTSSSAIAAISYAPSTYSQDGYSLQTEYINGGLNILGIAGPTPGKLNYIQEPEKTRSNATGTDVSIASLNVCYSINGVTPATGKASDYSVAKREKRVLEWLDKAVANIICLSEIDALWWNDIYNTLSDNYALSGNTSCYGLVNGEAHERKTDSYNPIFYSKSKYEKLDEGHFWLLEESPSVGNKICNWVLLKNKSDSTVFCLFNTHFSGNDSNTTFQSRYTEEQRLARLVKQTVSNLESSYRIKIPYIISGDFNINEGSTLYRALLNDCKVKDSKYIARNVSTATTFNNWGNYTGLNGKTIDFCLVSDTIDCQTYNIRTVNGSDGYLASDHAAVRLNLTINGNSSSGSTSDISDIFNFDFSNIFSWVSILVRIVKSLIEFASQIIASFN